jgi:hypothetical protein
MWSILVIRKYAEYSVCVSSRVGSQVFWQVVHDDTSHTALHWAKQVVGKVRDVYCLVYDQVKTLTGYGMLIFHNAADRVEAL